ncbi:Protein obstructor-E [Amphibalanus amphitrite]|uniref:Protein obstructor-E n=1 Tax=Amphibalanus amphitrite TaxID=1232801 RepID=A0A6A4VUX5_AMPAM|nr:Protein obstructor-E [Amphibalanus amphitrite]
MWCSQTLVVLLAAGAAVAQEAAQAPEFICPENEITGKFADPYWCDRYWDCFKGEATPVDCDDGTAFDPRRITQANPCDYIYKVNCTGREALGDPLGTGVCERMNGVYAHEDPNVCDKYYTCENNKPTLLACAPGLHFNPVNRLCDWPTAAKRGACDARTSLDGFTCDDKEYFTPSGQKIAHPTFPHPEDCTKFYVCKGGRVPALSGCDEGLVYNTQTSNCDVIENVPECDPNYTDYVYEDYPADAADPAANV